MITIGCRSGQRILSYLQETLEELKERFVAPETVTLGEESDTP